MRTRVNPALMTRLRTSPVHRSSQSAKANFVVLLSISGIANRSPRRRCEQHWRHVDAERPRRLQVDDELELGRLHDWQVGGLGALENVAGIDADLTKHVHNVGSVAHQSADCDMITIRISRRNFFARRQSGKLRTAAGEEAVASDEESIGSLARKGRKGRIDLACLCWR